MREFNPIKDYYIQLFDQCKELINYIDEYEKNENYN